MLKLVGRLYRLSSLSLLMVFYIPITLLREHLADLLDQPQRLSPRNTSRVLWVINKVDKLPWSRLAAVLALSLGIQPGVELVDRSARRLSSPEQHAATNEEPTNEAHLTSVCLPARASPVASQPRGKQASGPVRTGTSKECRRREAVLNSAARDTSQQGRDPGGRP